MFSFCKAIFWFNWPSEEVKHVPIGTGDLISWELALFAHRKIRRRFVNQPLAPKGQRRGQMSPDPQEYWQVSSTGIQTRCQRKSLSLSGSWSPNLTFQIYGFLSPTQGWNLSDGHKWQGSTLWGRMARFPPVALSHCKYRQHYSSKSL